MDTNKTVSTFSFRTGWHGYNDGDTWREYDGNLFLGRYTNLGGQKVEIGERTYGLGHDCYGVPTKEDVQLAVKRDGIAVVKHVIAHSQGQYGHNEDRRATMQQFINELSI